MSVTLSRTGKQMKLSQSTHLMANDRETVETAIAGDIIGIYDSGNFQIGDTLTDRKEGKALSRAIADLPARAVLPCAPCELPEGEAVPEGCTAAGTGGCNSGIS